MIFSQTLARSWSYDMLSIGWRLSPVVKMIYGDHYIPAETEHEKLPWLPGMNDCCSFQKLWRRGRFYRSKVKVMR